ncbi:centrosomal protein of 126 kDa isoform X2 [Paroedura picta]|uniref:centrosomal protein of 126 kDa isoform X2 n=1 Tax=Paroedura picta TaxID=143630 RepID=UPI004056FBC6
MEPGGGGGAGRKSGGGYYSIFPRAVSAGGRAAEGWRRSPSDSALSRVVSRRALSAFAPSTQNLRIFLERDLSKERHDLLKDQRQLHSRARKHFLETNKRRRALEEKWKEEEEKEQKFREHILLQRKLKQQEATEKFQRGHLPYAQRKRVLVQRKPEPKLDEAFGKIQITGLQLPLYRGDSRTSDTASLATRNGPFQWKQNMAKTGGDKIMEGNERANLDRNHLHIQQNLEEMQQQLQEQHLSNLQSFHQEVNEIANSESTPSADSLEAGDQIESFATPSDASSASAHLDPALHHSQDLHAKNKSFSDYDNMTFSKNQHVNNWLMSLNTSNIQRNSHFHDILVKHNVMIPEEQVCGPDQNPSLPSASEQKESKGCTFDENLAFMQNKRGEKCTLLKNPSSGTVSTEDTLATDKPVLIFNKATAPPDPSPVALVPEKHSEVLQNNRTSLAQPLNPIAATPVAFPTGQWRSTTPCNNGLSVNYWQKGKDVRATRCTEDTDGAAGAEMEKYVNHINGEASLFDGTYRSNLDQQNDNVSYGNFAAANLPNQDHQQNGNDKRKVVKLPKSILKKESKYEPSNSFKALVVNRGIRFGNQPVSAIRDSVELAKTKGKDTEFPRNYKKIRWFDEINGVQETDDSEKCSEQRITEIPRVPSQSSGVSIKATTSRTNLRSIPSSCLINSAFLENGQDHIQKSAKLANSGGSERNAETLISFEATGYHIAKQAWMTSKGDEIKSPCIGDLKSPKTNPRKGRTKMIKRPKSAKASTFTSKNRKGTIIRPKSASEAISVTNTQGKIMVPHPPYLSVADERTDQSGSSLSNEDQDLNHDTTDNPSLQNVSHVGPERPSEPPCTVTGDPLPMTSQTANTAQPVERDNNAIKRSPVYSENGLCVDRTATDEEIKHLWQGVPNGHPQKDGAADAVLRRKIHYDSIENKRRALLEQRKQVAGWKASYFGQNSMQAMKLAPSQSASEPVHATGGVGHSDEVSDSTTQFLVAEHLANTAATEGEILTYLDTAQQYKPTVLLNRPPRPGMSALSLEEHRVLQSLDRLNQRLQNVQETINQNQSTTSILQTISPLVTAPSHMDVMPSVQRCKNILADARTLTQRRF